ncbi:MAG: methylated-DNA--[protein]-cysteine S-methyltransferase [Sedimentisphaerales bacterium]|nr:methylated-DNA--[protein]-cysteine S-methyltransferase [Sedimentisphaerales bacterium]
MVNICAKRIYGEIFYRLFNTSWGPVGIVVQKGQLIRLLGPGSSKQVLKHHLQKEFKSGIEHQTLLKGVVEDVKRYFDKKTVEFKCKINLFGFSDFSRGVLKACSAIKIGKLISYSELGKKAGRQYAGRAVGRVMAKNPVPIIIPCHRVIRSDGSIGGYSGIQGDELKRHLIEYEKELFRKVE